MTTAIVTELLKTFRTLSAEEQAEFHERLHYMRVNGENEAWQPTEEELVEIRRRVKAIEDGEETYTWEEVQAEMHERVGRHASI